jgi:Cytochrome P450
VAAGAGLWHRAAQDETIGGKYKLRKNTFRHGARDGAAPRSQRLGSEPGCLRSREFQPRGRGQAPVNAWKPFGNGQRACIGRGFAMHEAALAIGMILQRFKLIDITATRCS